MSFENQEAGFGQTALMAEEGVEYLIYDFSLSECDSFPYNGEEYLLDHPEVIFQIDEAEINGSVRKVFWFDDDCEGGEHYYDHGWIEGIGSNFGLLHSLQLLSTLSGAEYRLVEILQDGERIYTNPEFEGVDYDALPELGSFEERVSLFPNPITEYGILDFSQLSDMEKLDIIQTDGRYIKSLNVKGTSSYKISKRDFGSGMFVFVLSGRNGNTFKGKMCID